MEPHDTVQGKLLGSLHSAEVLAVRFLTIPQHLILDSRTTELDGPMIKVVDPVSSAEERLSYIRRLRPRFQLPTRISALWWQWPYASFESAVGDALTEHMHKIGGLPAADAAREALAELARLERRETYRVIRGIGYRTLWE